MTTEELQTELTTLRRQLPNVLAYHQRKALVNRIVEVEKAIKKVSQQQQDQTSLFDR